MSDYIRTINGKKIVSLLTNKFHITQTQELTAEKNGTYEPDEDHDAFSKVTVALPLQEKTIAKNGVYEPDENYEAFNKVTVALPLQEKTLTQNGEYEPTSPNVGFNKITVAVPTEEKTVTANGEYEPTSPNVGFSKVTVAVPIAIKKTIAIEFPGMEIQSSDISAVPETSQSGLPVTRYKCNKTSSINTYSGYKLVESCFVNYNSIDLFMPHGEVWSTDTELSSETVGFGTAKRWAKFVDGVLTTWTTYSLDVIKPVSSASIPVIPDCTATLTIT